MSTQSDRETLAIQTIFALGLCGVKVCVQHAPDNSNVDLDNYSELCVPPPPIKKDRPIPETQQPHPST